MWDDDFTSDEVSTDDSLLREVDCPDCGYSVNIEYVMCPQCGMKFENLGYLVSKDYYVL